MFHRLAALALASGLAALIAGAPASSATRPDLSGAWKLNAEKSSGENPPTLTVKIEQNEPKLKLTVTSSEGGEDHVEILDLTMDGAEHKRMREDREITETAVWDGPVLVLHASGKGSNGEYSWTRRISLSADGKTMTAEAQIKDSNGESKHTEVFDKAS